VAIVQMKRLRLIALEKDRDQLFDCLLHIGCVEVREPSSLLADESYAALLHRVPAAVAETRGDLASLQHAIDVLHQYAPQKGGLFTPRDQIDTADLLNAGTRDAVLQKAAQINDHARKIGQLNAKEARLAADRLALQPWSACSIPLDDKGSKCVDVLLGSVPSSVSFDSLVAAVDENVGVAEVALLTEDRELKYLEVLVLKDSRQQALDTLRSFGFSFAQLKDLSGTASDNIRRLDDELNAVASQREKEISAVQSMGGCLKELKAGLDRVNQVLAAESAKERLLSGGSIIVLDGWASVPEIPALEKALANFDCAYELLEPEPEEYPEVPVELRNGKIVRTLNMVTDMYSLPAYGSIDPNPLMAPFFIFFYGFMMADMGYGLLMMLASWIIMKKAKPNGPTMRHMIPLMGFCGISTFIMGALTGGFFGDLLPQLALLINPNSTFQLPALFSPLDDALAVLVGSLAIGLVQIFTGMAVSMYKQIKRGETMAALCNEGAWFAVFLCIAVAAVTGQVTLMIAIILVLLILTQGYGKEGVLGKLMGIFGSLYNNITGYFSDIMSYSRLMALMLAGAVVAQVFNKLGAITGNVVFFFLIAMVGNALNFALNLLGCFVHDMRLQCLEFFGRFYEDGGKPFRPLNITTQYVDVIKK